MPELLFELGCEEMPARAVGRAAQDLADTVAALLGESQVEISSIRSLGTPRRLILGIDGLPDKQPDREVETRGPRLEAAYGSDGAPSKALEGFCRGQGVDPSSVIQRDNYVWAVKSVTGQPMGDLLATILPQAVKSLKFDKTMRWGLEKARFVRPVRWILARLGDSAVDFELFGVRSGLTSRGHRFMAPGNFEPTGWDNHLSQLRTHFVEPDPAERWKRIVSEARSVARGEPDLPEALVDENVQLTEWPTAHEGVFAEEYLELPEPVLVTAMAKHERFFPVRSRGKITNRFVSVRNNGDEASVRAGNEWVLNARFNDARFFFNEDKKRSMDDFLAMTERMLFQDGLGTVRQRADRLAVLNQLVDQSFGGTDSEAARLAGLYAKADLSSGLVSELSSLQGVVGGEYAMREGFPPAAAQAIGSQYVLPDDYREEFRPGLALLVSDQLDKLAGFLGLGLVPKGSSDPFALRRAAGLAIQAVWLSGADIDFEPLLSKAFELYAEQKIALDPTAARQSLAELLDARYRSLMPEVDHDVHDAAMAGGSWERMSSPNRYASRVKALEVAKKDAELIQTFTRPLNILNAERAKGEVLAIDLRSDELTDEGRALLLAVETGNDLRGPIHAFFEATMVNDPDLAIRSRNLSLLLLVEEELLQTGDYGKLVIV